MLGRRIALVLVGCLLGAGVGTVTVMAGKNNREGQQGGNSPSPFAGHWTYRSFRNNAEPVRDVQKDPQKLVNLLFAEGEWVVEDTKDESFKGQLLLGPGAVMDLTGSITPATATSPPRLHVNGKGRPGTSTEAYFYDYDGALAFVWPNGVKQTAAIVGSVIRVKPHDGAPAGYVASFIAVKRD